jgi:septal ring factor EnvC (AmiA/AmiB activator)
VALPDSKPRYRENLAFIYAVNGNMEKARDIAGKDVDLATLDSDLKNFRAQQKPESVIVGDDRTMMGVHPSLTAAAQSLTATVAADRQRATEIAAAEAAKAAAAEAAQAAAQAAAQEAAAQAEAAQPTAAPQISAASGLSAPTPTESEMPTDSDAPADAAANGPPVRIVPLH